MYDTKLNKLWRFQFWSLGSVAYSYIAIYCELVWEYSLGSYVWVKYISIKTIYIE